MVPLQAQLQALGDAEVALRRAMPHPPRAAYQLFAGEIQKCVCWSLSRCLLINGGASNPQLILVRAQLYFCWRL